MTAVSSQRETVAPDQINIRQRTEDDDPAIIALRNEARPWLPPSSVEEYRWHADPRNQSPDELNERWVADIGGQVIGLYFLSRLTWIERKNTFGANVGVPLAHRNQGVGSALFSHLLDRAQVYGATRLYGQVSADDDAAAAFVERRGFSKTGRASRMSRLVIDEADLDGYDGIYDRLHGAGIEIRTMAEVGTDNEPAWRRMYDMNIQAAQDIPSTEAFSGPPFEAFMKWQNAPGNGPDQTWVAYDGDRPVGSASVSRRGDDSSFNNLTGVDREYRGQGIARALKLKTIEWARAKGIKTMFTNNDYENKPMLSINIPLGYVEVPAELEVVRDLE